MKKFNHINRTRTHARKMMAAEKNVRMKIRSCPNDKVTWKDRFVDRYSGLTDWKLFSDFSQRFLRRSIRVNTLKASVPGLKKLISKDWGLVQVPWCREGFWIEHRGEGDDYRRDVGNIPEHSLGLFFIQEAASMIPPVVLGPKPGETVLDMCASPGAKTTQIAAMMKNTGVLVANDYRTDRLKALGLNMQRMGVQNSVRSMVEGRRFSRLGEPVFDRILLDAPCSGTGTIRKSLKTVYMWNPNMVRRLAGTQRQLIETAYSILKPGGTLVYSTCTLEPEEDEAVVSFLLERFPDAVTEKIVLKGLRRSAPVTGFMGQRFHEGVKECLRIWPQDNDTEGFFVAKIRKVRNG